MLQRACITQLLRVCGLLERLTVGVGHADVQRWAETLVNIIRNAQRNDAKARALRCLELVSGPSVELRDLWCGRGCNVHN